MMKALKTLLQAVSSLRLTLFCLAASLVLVFAGTIAQVKLGLYFVQEQYFQSWIIWWSPGGGDWKIPVFPGGHCIGAFLLVNLLASFILRLSWSPRKIGIHLIHVGLIIMLVGALVTDLFSVHSFMRLKEGETKNYSEDPARMELALIELSESNEESVTAIPGEVLEEGGTIAPESLPFKVVVRSWFRNSKLKMLNQEAGSSVPAATNGTGQRVALSSAPRATRMDERDIMSAVVEIIPAKDGKSLGTWLVSDALAAPQDLEIDGRKWSLQLRPARYYKPYSLTLKDFTHETYPGTMIPKNFSSKVDLTDTAINDTRQILIYMNHPLRYKGDTYYQSGFEPDNSGTVLQVVRNPSYQTPYIACVVISVGMTIQFLFHLVGFARRAISKPAP